MIAKFNGVPGKNLARLIHFIHGGANLVTILGEMVEDDPMIVKIESIRPDNPNGTVYEITLNILECLPKPKLAWLPKQKGESGRVDPRYLVEVYKILGEDRLTEHINRETSTMGEPVITSGTEVKTTQPDISRRKAYTDEGWVKRRWGIQGTVVSNHHHMDSPGLHYIVKHKMGPRGYTNLRNLKSLHLNQTGFSRVVQKPGRLIF